MEETAWATVPLFQSEKKIDYGNPLNEETEREEQHANFNNISEGYM